MRPAVSSTHHHWMACAHACVREPQLHPRLAALLQQRPCPVHCVIARAVTPGSPWHRAPPVARAWCPTAAHANNMALVSWIQMRASSTQSQTQAEGEGCSSQRLLKRAEGRTPACYAHLDRGAGLGRVLHVVDGGPDGLQGLRARQHGTGLGWARPSSWTIEQQSHAIGDQNGLQGLQGWQQQPWTVGNSLPPNGGAP